MTRSSITLIGSKINSSDDYAVVGILENGTRDFQFARIQSQSADGNVTVANLEAGKLYTVEIVSVIGTSTNCGGGNSTDSAVTSLRMCTGQSQLFKVNTGRTLLQIVQ